MDSLQQLPNIGAVLADRLRRAGVDDAGELRRLGSGRAFEKIRPELPEDACTHTLLALEGALRGMRWTAIPQTERDTLVHRVMGPPAAPTAAAATAATPTAAGPFTR